MNLGSPLKQDTNDQWIEGGEQAVTRLLDPAAGSVADS